MDFFKIESFDRPLVIGTNPITKFTPGAAPSLPQDLLCEIQKELVAINEASLASGRQRSGDRHFDKLISAKVKALCRIDVDINGDDIFREATFRFDGKKYDLVFRLSRYGSIALERMQQGYCSRSIYYDHCGCGESWD